MTTERIVMARITPSDIDWRKARISGANGQCAEVASTGNRVAVRDSKDVRGPRLYFGTLEWIRFMQATKNGEFDNMA